MTIESSSAVHVWISGVADGGFVRSAGLLVIKFCSSASAKAALMIVWIGARASELRFGLVSDGHHLKVGGQADIDQHGPQQVLGRHLVRAVRHDEKLNVHAALTLLCRGILAAAVFMLAAWCLVRGCERLAILNSKI
jgi:hypothetical protein